MTPQPKSAGEPEREQRQSQPPERGRDAGAEQEVEGTRYDAPNQQVVGGDHPSQEGEGGDAGQAPEQPPPTTEPIPPPEAPEPEQQPAEQIDEQQTTTTRRQTRRGESKD